MAWIGVTTNAGVNLMAGWTSGTVLNIKSAVAGSGIVPEVALLAQTALVNQKQTASIVSGKIENGLHKIKIQIRASDKGYVLNQIGLFASLGEEEQILFALFQNETGITIPSIAESPDFLYIFYGYLNVSNKGNFSLTVEPSALVSHDEMEKKFEDHNSDAEAHPDIRKLLNNVGSALVLDITIPVTGWIRQESGEQEDDSGDFCYYLDVMVSKVTSEQFPSVALHKSSLDVAKRANLCPTVQTYDGAIRFWAKQRPTSDMTATVALLTRSGTTGSSSEGGESSGNCTVNCENRLTDLENKLSDLMYEPITVTNFTNSVGTVEMGTVVQSVTLAWKFSKTPVSVTLDGEQVAADSTGTTLTGLNMVTGKTWTLSATDERGAVATKTTSISFLNGVYTGAGSGDIAILSLSRSLQSGRARTFTATAGAGEYLWYACPTRYGTPTFAVGGFEGGFSKVRTESFTNSSGYTESYDVWRSDNAGLGVTTVVVK